MFVPAARKAALRQPGPLLAEIVGTELRSERLPVTLQGPLNPQHVQLATTSSRSILGFMNDNARHCRYAVAAAGGLDTYDTKLLNYRLRRTLHNRDGYIQPIDVIAERLQRLAR